MGTSTPLEPDRNQIEIFVDAIFRHARSGFVSLRAFLMMKTSIPYFISASGQFQISLRRRRRRCPSRRPISESRSYSVRRWRRSRTRKMPREERPGRRGRRSRWNATRIPEAARAALEPLLGPPTLVVRSGGIWKNNGVAHDKMHLHWRLAAPANDQEQLTKLKRAREIAAHIAGADTSNVPVCHPISWPGSWHRKAEPRLCEIILDASDLDHEIDLDEALLALEPFAPAAPAGGNGALCSCSRAATGANSGQDRMPGRNCTYRSIDWP